MFKKEMESTCFGDVFGRIGIVMEGNLNEAIMYGSQVLFFLSSAAYACADNELRRVNTFLFL